MPVKTMSDAVRELYYWQYAQSDDFTACLYYLIGKADSSNRRTLAMAFPLEYEAWANWYGSKDPIAFFKSWKCWPQQEKNPVRSTLKLAH